MEKVMYGHLYVDGEYLDHWRFVHGIPETEETFEALGEIWKVLSIDSVDAMLSVFHVEKIEEI
jgi:hypothetical protein